MNKSRKKRPVRRDRPQPTTNSKRVPSRRLLDKSKNKDGNQRSIFDHIVYMLASYFLPSEWRQSGKPKGPWRKHRGLRETLESLITAVILALLLRTYIGEPFVIPTGSMAPTLMGRHIRLDCDQCGFHYVSGASSENGDRGPAQPVRSTTCPNCRFPQELRRGSHKDATRFHNSISGDRIIVNKFAYLIGSPQRWDVIVFRYPHDAKRNYIKRLVGLPNETIRIFRGDIYARQQGESEFKIARKPPEKLRAMLQLVHDSNYVGQELYDAGWPSRWQEWSPSESDRDWEVDRQPHGQSFQIEATGDETHWLRYRHLPPRELSIELNENGIARLEDDWSELEEGRLPADVGRRKGDLITDFYSYNDSRYSPYRNPPISELMLRNGIHWVGDLCVECDVEVKGEAGELSFDLVEGGTHFTCTIDIQTGIATLKIPGHEMRFTDSNGMERDQIQGQTSVKGPGRYDVRFSNVDSELTLWINERVVEFEHPATYISPKLVTPKWSQEDPGDAEPVGVGSRNANLLVHRLRVLRDVYYIAPQMTNRTDQMGKRIHELVDYKLPANGLYENQLFLEFRYVLRTPELWQDSLLFDSLNEVTYKLKEGQLFPMGDNSPGSLDARIWGDSERQDDKFVSEELLMGKAAVIYFPHSPVFSIWPDFKRFGFIR